MAKKHRSKFGMSGFIALIVSLMLGIGIGTLGTRVPDVVEQANVKNARIANSFDIDTYTGWVYAYNAIGRETQILYNKNPHDRNSNYFQSNLNYPQYYLPDLLTNFGIAVQKPYTSNYIFAEQKNDLINFYNSESTLVNHARYQFKPMNKKVNANDALVIEALKYYAILIDKLNATTSTLTLKDSENIAIGKHIKKDVGEESFTRPLKYSNLAMEYLATNIRTYYDAYKKYAQHNNGFTNKEEIDNIIASVPK